MNVLARLADLNHRDLSHRFKSSDSGVKDHDISRIMNLWLSYIQEINHKHGHG